MVAECDNPFFKWVVEKPMNIKAFSAEARKSFLTAVKHDPAQVLNFIRENARNWTIEAAFQLKTGVVFNSGDEQKMLEYMKVHFSQELAELPG